jgi:hypothetical protein
MLLERVDGGGGGGDEEEEYLEVLREDVAHHHEVVLAVAMRCHAMETEEAGNQRAGVLDDVLRS